MKFIACITQKAVFVKFSMHSLQIEVVAIMASHLINVIKFFN